MAGFGIQQLFIIFGVIPLVAWLLGKGLGALLKDNQRRMVGGAIVMVISAALAIYGVVSVNSTGSRIASSVGSYDTTGIGLIVAGGFFAIVGFVTLISRQKISLTADPNPTRKCPYCAESIQPEASLCRFCGKTLGAHTAV